ncbi:hypothetical protein C8F04DRAFT_1198278 [Mycena alexandri]|uniref:Uncharacterized protein n=1 Tax=Mycena alexandri TaxID=1745969 RepID=A0AAD6S0G9_9AGAR|nr:hypothetical protein C8F04DRAFT_1198278 [Mycena alexandri]
MTLDGLLFTAGEGVDVATLVADVVCNRTDTTTFLSLTNDNYPAGVNPVAHFRSSVRVFPITLQNPGGESSRTAWNIHAAPPSRSSASNRAWISLLNGLDFDSEMHYVGRAITPALLCSGCKSFGHIIDPLHPPVYPWLAHSHPHRGHLPARFIRSRAAARTNSAQSGHQLKKYCLTTNHKVLFNEQSFYILWTSSLDDYSSFQNTELLLRPHFSPTITALKTGLESKECGRANPTALVHRLHRSIAARRPTYTIGQPRQPVGKPNGMSGWSSTRRSSKMAVHLRPSVPGREALAIRNDNNNPQTVVNDGNTVISRLSSSGGVHGISIGRAPDDGAGEIGDGNNPGLVSNEGPRCSQRL